MNGPIRHRLGAIFIALLLAPLAEYESPMVEK
jgi:hypothetical protein